jgi:ribulose-phosphate 3-epimerase
MHAPIIAPSILAADHGRLAEEIQTVERAGADWIHLDVMDGHFVPNLTFGPPIIGSLRNATKAPFDVHLMIEQPELSIDQYAAAGANHILVHPEASVHLHRTLARIRDLGAKPGVVMNPSTPIAAVAHVLHMVDLVLVMSVNPGFGGQKFLPEVLPKTRALRALIDERGHGTRIAIDGGIDEHTVGRAAAAGASVFIAGNAVFKSKDYAASIRAIRENAARATLEPVANTGTASY